MAEERAAARGHPRCPKCLALDWVRLWTDNGMEYLYCRQCEELLHPIGVFADGSRTGYVYPLTPLPQHPILKKEDPE